MFLWQSEIHDGRCSPALYNIEPYMYAEFAYIFFLFGITKGLCNALLCINVNDPFGLGGHLFFVNKNSKWPP